MKTLKQLAWLGLATISSLLVSQGVFADMLLQPEGRTYLPGDAVWLNVKADEPFPANSRCLDDARTTYDRSEKPIDEARFYMSEVRSVEELYQNLGIQAAARFGIGFFGNLNLSAEYNHSSFFRAERLAVLIRVDVERVAGSVTEAFLKQGVNASTITRDDCGDGYVSETRNAASFAALVYADFESAEKRDEFSAHLSYTQPGGSASANVFDQMRAFSSVSNKRIEIIQKGGDSLPTNPEDIGQLVQHAIALANSPADKLRPTYFSVARYPGVTEQPILDRMSEADAHHVHALADYYDYQMQRLEELEKVDESPEQYAWGDYASESQALEQYIDKLQDHLDSFRSAVRDFLSGKDGAKMPAMRFHEPMPKIPARLDAFSPDAPGKPSGGCTSWAADGSGCVEAEVRLHDNLPIAPVSIMKLPRLAPGMYRATLNGTMSATTNCSNDNRGGWGAGWLEYGAQFSIDGTAFVGTGNGGRPGDTGALFSNRTVNLPKELQGPVELRVESTHGEIAYCHNDGGMTNQTSPRTLGLDPGFVIRIERIAPAPSEK